MRTPSLSVVIPVYNSREILPTLVKRLGEVLPTITDRFEVILVNDSSPDGSWYAIQELQPDTPWLVGINLMRNSGQHNALLCGIRQAQYEVIVTMDDDLQHPPDQIEHLLEALTDEIDVVYGVPKQQQHGLLRDVASYSSKFMMRNLFRVPNATDLSAFRVFRTYLRDAFQHYSGTYVSIDVLLTWGTSRFTSVKVTHAERFSGTSNYTFRKLLRHLMNMLAGYSTIPLRLASYLGFLLTMFGIGILLYVFIRVLTLGQVVPGFAFLASIISIFSGAQMLTIGILGEYIARMYVRVAQQPAYTIKHIARS